MSSCAICARSGVDHNKVVARCLASPFWTGRYLCGFDKMSFSLHRNLSLWLENGIRNGKRRFIILTPRDHYKTTLFGVSTMLWRILNDADSRILYMMSAADQAATKIDIVKNILTSSQTLHHYFPDRVVKLSDPATKWRSDFIKVPYRKGQYADGTIEAHGVTSMVTGGHFTWHIFDDLIDETMVYSDTMQKKAVNFLKRSSALHSDIGRDIELIIGTRWPGIFYDWLLQDSGLTEFYETLVVGCFVDQRFRDFMASIGKEVTLPDGHPIFPEQFKKEDLEFIRRKSEFDFAHQWLNIRADEDTRRFKESDIRHYMLDPDMKRIHYNQDGVDKQVMVSSLYRVMTVDPATGEHSKTDESAIIVAGIDRQTGLVFILDAWDGRVLPGALIDKVLELAKAWDVQAIAPEDVSYQKTFKHFLRQEMVRRNTWFNIRPVKPGTKSKGARIIDSLQPFIACNQYWFRRNQGKLINELINLQVVGGKVHGRSPNLADALAYTAEFVKASFSESKQDSDDIEYRNPYKSNNVAAYGLECLT